ncbi:hypothetical protein NLI96_g7293 [Meripilus lineatus]|uniref:Arrestin-like N-terminal domain-containing protein n=1 Tax=Meripilus lineatus TaxID=2056292 RepID=A0AAD5YHC0_9APHY|nr:hypothetical protein NLI96_g7293 [Physisporinus lineatus]
MSIQLHFGNWMRVGGEMLNGEVELKFPQIIEDGVEEVHVKLRGRVQAQVGRYVGQSYILQTERIEIARETVSIWTKGSAWPSTGESVLRLPFQFLLPIDVQPSCKYVGACKDGDVSYVIEAVGVRQGLLSRNRRVSRPFAVVPPDPAGLEIRKSLLSGWSGPLKTVTKSDKMRRGVWGSYAESKIELVLPDLPTFPLFTKIPFTLRIITTTKEMKYDEKDEHKDVFPEPPHTPQGVTFILRRKMKLRAQGWDDKGSETIGHLGGLGKDSSPPETVLQSLSFTFDKKWVPSGNDKKVGSWRQETTVESAFELKCASSFATPILQQQNYIRVKIEFPGVGNHIEEDIPIEVNSGVITPTSSSGAPLYEGPGMNLDLPPTYWSATWDDDDKKVDPFASKRDS